MLVYSAPSLVEKQLSNRGQSQGSSMAVPHKGSGTESSVVSDANRYAGKFYLHIGLQSKQERPKARQK